MPAFVVLITAAPAVAHPALLRPDALPARSTMQVHFPLGRQAYGPQPATTFKLAPASPRKIGPTPARTPEFNPLKRRRMAMPALDPETQLAF